MAIPPLRPTSTDLDHLPLERLASNKAASQQDKLETASRGFEALLLRQILSEIQKPVFASKYTSNSTTSGIYRDMVVNQLAQSISQSGTLGLAQSLSAELGRQLTPNANHHPGPAAGSAGQKERPL